MIKEERQERIRQERIYRERLIKGEQERIKQLKRVRELKEEEKILVEERNLMRERRLKVWKLGFNDFNGLNYVNDPKAKIIDNSKRVYEVKLPLPKVTQITKGGAHRLFKKSKHIGYGLPSL